MIRIKRSEYTSQLSTDIGLIYFHCKGQERGSPNATLDGTLSGILCLDLVFLSMFGLSSSTLSSPFER